MFSMNTFLTKLSATLSKGILGLSMTLMGYQDNMEPNDTVDRFQCDCVCSPSGLFPALHGADGALPSQARAA